MNRMNLLFIKNVPFSKPILSCCTSATLFDTKEIVNSWFFLSKFVYIFAACPFVWTHMLACVYVHESVYIHTYAYINMRNNLFTFLTHPLLIRSAAWSVIDWSEWNHWELEHATPQMLLLQPFGTHAHARFHRILAQAQVHKYACVCCWAWNPPAAARDRFWRQMPTVA